MIANTQQGILQELRLPEIEKPVKQLYELYFEAIVTQTVFNGGNQEDGADIFQDAVLILIEKVKTNEFRGDSSIKTYLSAIARNLWLFELRTRERRKKRETVFSSIEITDQPFENPMVKKQQNSDLLSVLEKIGDTCKKILTGFYFEEKSMRDLLVEFDYQSEQVLRNRKSKCMKKLKELLQTNTDLLQNLTPIQTYE